MRVVAFAYHNMGIAGLAALERNGYEIVAIFTHEDDPAENCWFDSVRAWGETRRIPVACPDEILGSEWAGRIANFRPEMIFSFYYRRMIPGGILCVPRRGAYNLHGSLLPAYRGRCPVNWVLIHGEERTGVTLHHMVEAADAGDIVGQTVVPIEKSDTALTLYRKLCCASGELLDELLPLMKRGCAPRIPQDPSQGSYFGGRRPENGRIDWAWPAERIYNLIRAVAEPYPGAFCALPDGSRLMIWWGTPEEVPGEEGDQAPGRIDVEGDAVFVRTGAGRIRLLDVEDERERTTGGAIARYFGDKEGMRLS